MISLYAGLTSQTIDVFLQDSSSATGQGLSGLTYNSAGLACYYRKGATGSATSITLATQTVGGAYSSGGFVEIQSTNMKGIYRFDIPNAVIDSEGFATIFFYGATNLAPTAIRIDCRPLPTDVKKFGGTNGTFSSGRPEVNTTHWAGTAVASATVRADLINIAGAAVSASTAQLGVNVVNAAGTAWGSGAITAASIAASALNGKGDWNVGKTGYSLTAGTGLGNQTADITGSLFGSVGSVTGNVNGSVASVVGNVGGNVNGTVTSVLGGIGGNVAGNVLGSVAYVAGNVTGSVGSVTTGVTVTTNNDKTGYSLTAVTGLGNQTADITGNLSGSVGSISGITFPTNFGVLGITGAGSLSYVEMLGNIDTDVEDKVQQKAEAALVAYNLDHLIHSAVNTDFATTVHLNSVIGHLADNGTSASFDRTTDSLEAQANVSVLTAADVWAYSTREITGGYVNVNNTTDIADSIWGYGVGLQPAGTYGYVFDTFLDAAISSRASQTSVDTIDGIVDSILVDTAEIGAAGAGLTAVPWNAAWDAQVESEVTDALNAYDPPTNTELASAVSPLALETSVQAIDSQLPPNLANTVISVSGIVDSNVASINSSSSAAVRLANSANAIIPGTIDTASFTPTTSQFEADDITEATADHYKGRVVIFTSGSLLAQASPITAYELVGGKGRFTVMLLTEAPSDNNTFIII